MQTKAVYTRSTPLHHSPRETPHPLTGLNN